MFEVLRVIIDDKSLSLFDTIALSSANTDIMINRLGLTKKQYYPRIYDLRKAGLIRRSNTKYYLTSLGKIVYEVQLMIGKAVESYWKLKALDSFSPQLPAEEYNRVIDNLLEGNNEMKEILHRYNNKNDTAAAQKEKVYTQ